MKKDNSMDIIIQDREYMITKYDIQNKHITMVSQSSRFNSDKYANESISSHLSEKFGRNVEYEVDKELKDEDKEENDVLSKKVRW